MMVVGIPESQLVGPIQSIFLKKNSIELSKIRFKIIKFVNINVKNIKKLPVTETLLRFIRNIPN